MKKIKITVGLFLLMISTVVILIFSRPQNGTLNFTINPTNSTISTSPKVTIVAGENKLKPGSYTVTASADGYLDKTSVINVTKSKTVTVNVELAKVSTPNVVSQTLQETTYKKISNISITILKSASYYNGSWLVAQIQTTSDPGIVVLKKDGLTGKYTVFLGPGTSFEANETSQLPPDVQSALKNGISQ